MISATDRPLRLPWFRAVPDREAYVFEYGGAVVRITGTDAIPLLSALLPYLDGRWTVGEIQQNLPDWDQPTIAQALSVLLSNGVITVAEPLPPAQEDEHLLTALMGPAGHGPTVEGARVGVAGTGRLATAVSTICEASGVRNVQRLGWSTGAPASVDLIIAAADDAELPQLDRWNRRMLDQGQPWMVILPFDGVCAGVGPLFIPGETACYACLTIRRRSVLEDPELARAYDGQPTYRPIGAAVTALLAGLAVHVGLRWVSRRDNRIPGVLYAVGLSPRPAVSVHEVFPVPRCPVCRLRRGPIPAPWYPPEAVGRDPTR